MIKELIDKQTLIDYLNEVCEAGMVDPFSNTQRKLIFDEVIEEIKNMTPDLIQDIPTTPFLTSDIPNITTI